SWRHGWKWSLTVALSMPCASAATARSTRSRGANCSADALYPSFSSAMGSFYTRLMAPVLTAVTDRVHFAQTDLVNWTLVAGSDEDGDGVMLIDAGFPGSRADVLDSLGQL